MVLTIRKYTVRDEQMCIPEKERGERGGVGREKEKRRWRKRGRWRKRKMKR